MTAPTPAPTRRDRARGALLGLAWGDVLGCPVEGWSAGRIRDVYDRYVDLPTDYPWARMPTEPKVRRRLRPLGLYSDDTQQALALLQVAAPSGRWDNARFAALLSAGRRHGAWRGTGRNFDAALQRLARGVAPERAGSPSAGIGAAMRIAPLGVRFADDPLALQDAVMESSLTTHADLRAAAVAYAIAWTTARLVAGALAHDVAAELPDAVAAIEADWPARRPEWPLAADDPHVVSRALAALRQAAPADFAALRTAVAAIARPHLAPGFTRAHPNQGFALLGGMHALAMALWPDIAPAQALAEIVQLGFDTDTVAAIAGGVLGARFGSGFVAVDRLLDRDRLLGYADALADGRPPPEDEPQFLQREAELTRREAQFQAELAANGR